MIMLSINPCDVQQTLLEDRIEAIALARKVHYDHKLEQAQLSHTGHTYSGVEAIEKYLAELEGLLSQWYECRCDKWEILEEEAA